MKSRTKAKRIQRKRTRGYKLPRGAVYVGRPTKWGNPFRVEQQIDGKWIVTTCDGDYRVTLPMPTQLEAKASAVRLYRAYLDNDGSQPGAIRDEGGYFLRRVAQEELRGKSLACWCAPGEPCHADVLLEVANA